jgi:hypothetical protein
MTGVEAPPRISPLVYYSLWLALSRFDIGLCREMEDRYRLKVSTLEKTKNAPVLSDLPVREFIADLAPSEFYDDIVWFAGEAAYSELMESGRIRHIPRFSAAMADALKRLHDMLPSAGAEVEPVGDGRIIRCRHSPFVILGLDKPSCGFISGFLSAAMLATGHGKYKADEGVCASLNSSTNYCLFELR